MNLPSLSALNFRKFCGKKFLALFRRVSKYMLAIILIGVSGWLGYFWYMSVYAYDWPEDQKNQYRSEYAGETSFREERFNATIGVLQERIKLHQGLPIVDKDIFFGTDL